MDQVFQEEELNLRRMEDTIDKITNRQRAQVQALQREIADFYAVDYEDLTRKKILIDQKEKMAGEIDYYEQYKPSPYFARLDLDEEIGEDYSSQTYFIGKKGLNVGSTVVIVDWRSPIGECYYAQNQTSFHVEKSDYLLSLRRALNIENEKLVSYNTEYDGNTVSLEGDVIDPFLLTVLKDKRRKNRLTDIIRSIQANQNDIIRRPVRESFIVQGCAGSGKTMILLHRLSYLKFNNRSMSLNGVKIITPNRDFNMHINALTSELDIDNIQRFTIEEYYVHLIHRYLQNRRLIIHFLHNEDEDASVKHESNLKSPLLGELYSTAFVSRLKNNYHQRWDTILKAIDLEKLHSCLDRYNIEFPKTKEQNALFADEISRAVNHAVDTAKVRKEEYIRLLEKKETLLYEYHKTLKLRIAILIDASVQREQVTRSLQDELTSVTQKITEQQNRSAAFQAEYQELAELDSGASDEARAIERELYAIRQGGHLYTNYSGFVARNDDVSRGISSSCNAQIEQIQTLEEQLGRTRAYNFLRRNALQRQLQAARDAFSTAAQAYLESIITAKEAEIANNNTTASAHRDELRALSEKIEAASKDIERMERAKQVLLNCLTGWVDTAALDVQELRSLSGQHKAISFWTKYTRSVLRLEEQRKYITEIKIQLEEITSQRPETFDKDITYLERCKSQAEALTAEALYAQTIDHQVQAVYKKHGVSYTETNYRHKLFILLVFCAMHYQRLLTVDTYLNIDEAQDISIVEYQLLREILGDRCVFNLYGDINQILLPERSIADWEDLDGVIGDTVFVLNENYRNTLQITEFCNEEFGAEIYPIGIKGKPVRKMSMNKALDWLIDKKKKNSKYRTAIIVKKAWKVVKDTVYDKIRHEDISWMKVDDKKISVVTVEQAKGLEFDAVVVLSTQMEINEQYIAYTRALDYLCIAS